MIFVARGEAVLVGATLAMDEETGEPEVEVTLGPLSAPISLDAAAALAEQLRNCLFKAAYLPGGGDYDYADRTSGPQLETTTNG